jgi:L-iditol 2-dehydrogenase
MLAAVYHGPEDIRLEQVPVPEIEPDEVLVKVLNASICGTDLRIYHGGHRKFPPGTVRIPGHETVGEIARVGAKVSGFEPGQRVFVAPNTGCGYCAQCVSGNNNLCADYQALGITIDGAFAEYVRIPAAAIQQGNLMPIHKEVDPAVAALIEPFACVVRGQNALHIQPGVMVLIMGAGPIGIMHLLRPACAAPGGLVSDLVAERLAIAVELGDDRVIVLNHADQTQVVMEESRGRGADVIIVAAPSHQAQEAALQLAAFNGRISFFGGLPKDHPTIRFDSNLVHYKELVVTGTTARSTHRQAAGREFRAVIHLPAPVSPEDALQVWNSGEPPVAWSSSSRNAAEIPARWQCDDRAGPIDPQSW